MNVVLVLDKLSTDLKAMRDSRQITDEDWKVKERKINSLRVRALKWEEAKERRNAQVKLTRRKMAHYNTYCDRKSHLYLLWEPNNPEVVISININDLSLSYHSPRDAIKWIKERRYCLFFNGVKFRDKFNMGELPGTFVDYRTFLNHYTIGGTSPHDVFRCMNVPPCHAARYLTMSGAQAIHSVPTLLMMAITVLEHKRRRCRHFSE